MPRILIAFCVVVLTFSVCAGAFAQYDSANKSRIGLRAGFYKPSDSRLSEMRSTWILPVLDFNLLFDEDDQPIAALSFTWGDEGSAFNKARFSSLGLTYIKRMGDSRKDHWYVGGGASLYMLKYQGYEIVGELPVFAKGDEKKLGFHVTAGREFGGSWFAELKYEAPGKLSRNAGPDVDFNGLMFTIGSRLAY